MLNFAVGPVMMEDETLKIGAEQIPYFRTDEFSRIMLKNESQLLRLANAPEDSRVIFLTASGTGAMEATIINLLSNKDRILVINGGSFGKRFKEICDIHELPASEVKLDYFEQITSEHLEPFEGKGYTALLVNVHETSTGVLYDMNIIKDFCKKNNIMLIVDAISSFLADQYDMCDLGANVTILSSQKAFALPPGMSYVLLDSKAQDRLKIKSVKSLYFDFKNYLKDGIRGQTPFTPGVGNLLQLSERLDSLSEKGIDKAIESVQEIALDFRKRIDNLPFEMASKYPSNALTSIRVRGKMTASEVFRYLKDQYQIFVVPNGGTLSDEVFRVGHIGSITKKDNDILINALNEMNQEGLL